MQATYQRAKTYFFWPKMKQEVMEFVKICDTCQRHKTEHNYPAGLLQPLPVPHQAWTHISMDFIEGLPTSMGKQVILVVVDCFSKYSHFLALKHPYTASSVTNLFLDQVYKLHSLRVSIVSD